MSSLKRVVVPLRVLIVLVFFGLVVAQVMSMPGQFRYMAQQNPELGLLPWFLLAIALVEILCVQVVLVCTWKLLTMVTNNRIFSTDAFVWVDAIVWAMITAWVVLTGLCGYLITYAYVTPEIRDPGLPMVLIGLVLVGGVVVLTVVVMRALLRQAAILQADLEVVI